MCMCICCCGAVPALDNVSHSAVQLMHVDLQAPELHAQLHAQMRAQQEEEVSR